MITPKIRPLDVLISSIHDNHLRKKFDMGDTRSKMKLSDVNYKHHVGQSLRDQIVRSIGIRFYPPLGL